MDDDERRAGLYVITRGTPSGLVCVCGVFDVFRGTACFGTCDGMNSCYFLVKEKQVISMFVKVLRI